MWTAEMDSVKLRMRLQNRQMQPKSAEEKQKKRKRKQVGISFNPALMIVRKESMVLTKKEGVNAQGRYLGRRG